MVEDRTSVALTAAFQVLARAARRLVKTAPATRQLTAEVLVSAIAVVPADGVAPVPPTADLETAILVTVTRISEVRASTVLAGHTSPATKRAPTPSSERVVARLASAATRASTAELATAILEPAHGARVVVAVVLLSAR